MERFARVFLPLWKRARFDGGGVNSVGRVHPGFEPPHARLYHLLVREIAGDVRRYFPEDVAPLLSRRHDIDVDLTGLSFRGRLERLAFAHLCSCVDVTRSEKASREAGCARLSPAHFSSTIPYAHFPPNASLSREQRALRPGKLLLRLAYKGVLPDEVLYRKKSWDDAVVSRSWRARGRRMMLRALPHYPHDFEHVDADTLEAWEPHSLLASGLVLRFFEELLVRRAPSDAPPTWAELFSRSQRVGLTHAA